MSQLSKFRAFAPEFSKLTDEQVQEMLDEASSGDIDLPTFGAQADRAVAHLAAFEFERIARRKSSPGGYSPTGAVKSVTGAEVAMGFSEPKAEVDGHADDMLRQHDHGLAYLALRDSRAGVGAFLG